MGTGMECAHGTSRNAPTTRLGPVWGEVTEAYPVYKTLRASNRTLSATIQSALEALPMAHDRVLLGALRLVAGICGPGALSD